MNSKEFVTWIRGFAAASNSYAITPKQWDEITDMLAKVKDEDDSFSYVLTQMSGSLNDVWSYDIS